MSYHNTNGLTRLEVEKAKKTVSKQDAAVMALFQRSPGAKASASQVLAGIVKYKLLNRPPLITSVRRSLSDLTKEGKLVKLAVTRPGPNGKPEHLFALNQ